MPVIRHQRGRKRLDRSISGRYTFSMNRIHLLLVALIVTAASAAPMAADEPTQSWPWREWMEPEFPFFSTVVDARSDAVRDNLTPRALVFPVGMDCYLAYDVDLLRVAVVWQAGNLPFLGAGMAVNSYPYGGDKVGVGISGPQPNGETWLENGIYAGVGVGAPSFADPRPRLPAAEQIVNGGLDPKLARFLGVRFSRHATIEYEIDRSVQVEEQFLLNESGLVRRLKIGPHAQPLYFVVAKQPDDDQFTCTGPASIDAVDGHVVCRVQPSASPEVVSIICSEQPRGQPATDNDTGKRWREVVRLPISSDPNLPDQPAFIEPLPLPLDNPFGRAVRAAAFDFFNDGRAALVTFDGDVWLAEGLVPGSTQVTWSRFTSGLHEPLSIAVRDGDLFVFDRNGLWRLLDRDHNGEADYHELFCSRIGQTSETREFATAMRVAKDGSFIVCKPGQQKTYGSVLRVAPDGQSVRLVARGFRQPFLGYDPATDQIAVSDQQGHWVPSTPVHFVVAGGFYGFPHGPADYDRTITPPLTWIPHLACSSSTSIIWTRNAPYGPLSDVPLLLSYHQPKLFQIHTDLAGDVAQGGATALDLQLNAPLLSGAMNPADGLLYVTGFKIWGTSAGIPTYLGRLRYNPENSWTLPTEIRVAQRGILLRFAVPLDPRSLARPQSFQVRRWNYQRSSAYGSAHYRLDGQAGTESLPVAAVKLSNDGKSVFLGIPGMREVMQIEVSYEIAAKNGTTIRNQSYLTAHALRSLNLPRHGFADNEVDLDVNHPALVNQRSLEPSLERGARYYTQLGCAGCHSVDGTTEGKNGPSWLDLYGSQRTLMGSGQLVRADEAYLRESILNPAAKVAEGAINGEAGMPIYDGVLSDEQVDSLLLYIKALADEQVRSQLAGSLIPDAQASSRKWNVEDFRDELSGPLRGRSFEEGKLAFLTASCFACHRVGQDKGGQVGPDLSKLDAKMRGLELLTHIIEPSRRIDDPFKSRIIMTTAGEIIAGFVVSENKTEIRITTDPLAQQDPTVLRKDEVEAVKVANVSAMPADLLNGLNQQQILDLLAYIESRGDPEHAVYDQRMK